MRTCSRSAFLFLSAYIFIGSGSGARAENPPAVPFYFYPFTAICVDPDKNPSSSYGGPGQLPACDDAILERAHSDLSRREANFRANGMGAQAAAAAAAAPSGLVLVAEKDTTNPKEEIRFKVDVTNGVRTEPPAQMMSTEDGLQADNKHSQHLLKWLGVPDPRPVVSVKNVGVGCLSVDGKILRPQESKDDIALTGMKEIKVVRGGIFTLTYYAHTIAVNSAACGEPAPSPMPPTPKPPMPPTPTPKPPAPPTPTPKPPMPPTPTPKPPMPPTPTPKPPMPPTPTPKPPMPPTATPTPKPPVPPTPTPTPTSKPPVPSPRPSLSPRT